MAEDKMLRIDVVAIDNASPALDGLSKKLDKLNGQFNTVSSVMEKSWIKKNSGALLGLGLSVMFVSMMFTRMFNKLIVESVNAYRIMGTETSIFVQKTNELAASWEFFKFGMIDALSNTELFAWFIDLVISLINWFGGLSEGWRAFIALSVVIGAAGSALAGFASNIALLILSLEMLGMLKPFSWLVGVSWEGIKWLANQTWTALKGLGGWIKGIAAATWEWTAALLSNPITWIVVLVVALIYLFAVLVNKVGGVKEAFYKMGYVIGTILNLIGTGVMEMVIAPIRLVILALNAMILAYNTIAGSLGVNPIEYFEQPELGLGVTNTVQGKLNEFYDANIGQEKSASEAFSDTNKQIADAIRDAMSSWTVEIKDGEGKLTPQS